MNKLINILNLIPFLISFSALSGQNEYVGKVFNFNSGETLAGTEVIVGSSIVAITDEYGQFTIKRNKVSEISFLLYHENFEILDTTVSELNSPGSFYLVPLSVHFSEIEVAARREELFAIRQLRDIEGATINAGKKTEVVVMDKVIANLAANQGRQIYAQVSGLNIYEGSDGGVQLSIGGRGLDPNRTSNFNTRQNGYDISADVLGYPESYYTPPANAIREIQIIRGASSLQYGTQFGGLINFKLNSLEPDKKFGISSSQTVGSFGLFDSYNSVGYNDKKWSVNAYFNYKQGNGYRPNSAFKMYNFFTLLEYKLNKNSRISGEITYYRTLAQQAGGLTDQQFKENPLISLRERNWFNVNWLLYNIKYELDWSQKGTFSVNFFGLDADRKAIGFRGNPQNLNENPITAIDEVSPNGTYLNPRDLIIGNFNNYGLEAKILNTYQLWNNNAVFLLGLKWYNATNSAIQGPGSTGSDADFSIQSSSFPDYPNQSEYQFPNHNFALFGEHIFYLGQKWSITPGFRFEYIATGASGTYNQVFFDNAGNPLNNKLFSEDRQLNRQFLLMGLGTEFKPFKNLNFYGNVSQNYRSITFSDIRIVSPTFIIDPNIKDERGWTGDLGVRGRMGKRIAYNAGAFGVLYQDRIGIIFDQRANRVRKNIGDAITSGVETLIDVNIIECIRPQIENFGINFFSNLTYTYSRYLNSENQNVTGKKVEFVPEWNWKSGLTFTKNKLQVSYQFTYLSKQFTDAQNSAIASPGDLRSGIIGEIPAYKVSDLSISYSLKWGKINSGINNVWNEQYFTRRATGYPGPGIIPSPGRNWYLGLVLIY